MSTQPMLPEATVWRETGHLTEVCVTALADAELSLVPMAARDHALSCDACRALVEKAAIESAFVSNALLEAMKQPATSRMPVSELVAGLAFAAIGAVPSLVNMKENASGLIASAQRLLVIGPKLFFAFVHKAPNTATWSTVSVGCALVLCVFGALIARRSMPRVSQGALR